MYITQIQNQRSYTSILYGWCNVSCYLNITVSLTVEWRGFHHQCAKPTTITPCWFLYHSTRPYWTGRTGNNLRNWFWWSLLTRGLHLRPSAILLWRCPHGDWLMTVVSYCTMRCIHEIAMQSGADYSSRCSVVRHRHILTRWWITVGLYDDVCCTQHSWLSLSFHFELQLVCQGEPDQAAQ